MKSYSQYINENKIGKLIFDGDVQFESDVDWKISIDISEFWNNYNDNKIDESSFVGELIKSFKEKEKEIKEANCWNNIVKELNKLHNNLQNSNSIYNNIYDICDKNLIQLKV
mgnify:CR=1 FL=1